ncbi:hypothetical protein EDD85DRAFT_794413 [Armillaria nabsnona]|nr:hypothetical protein EDD85DRAFT_794413 [Armillaria nabsnona]
MSSSRQAGFARRRRSRRRMQSQSDGSMNDPTTTLHAATSANNMAGSSYSSMAAKIPSNYQMSMKCLHPTEDTGVVADGVGHQVYSLRKLCCSRPCCLKQSTTRKVVSWVFVRGPRRNAMRRLVDFILLSPIRGDSWLIYASLLLQTLVKPSVKLPEG